MKFTSTSGMTLLEIMVVIIIIGLVSGLVGVAVFEQLDAAKEDTARTQIANISQALDLYRLKIGKYPGTSEGLNALTNPPNNARPFMDNVPKDPWGNDYVYTFPGSHNKGGFDLESYGSDGQDGGEMDIENWSMGDSGE